MSCFIKHNFEIGFRVALLSFLAVVCCATLEAQQTTEEPVTFEVSGRVTAKSESGLQVQTKDGEAIEIAINDSTDFALRMASPWFDAKARTVIVDGTKQANGQRHRIVYSLPEGQLYLLAQFRSVSHRDRILKQPSWRINNYLISDQPIESVVPSGDDLLLAGKLDLENSELVVGDNSWPIVLGFRSATLRGRSFEDIIAGDTVVLVNGSESDNKKVAQTILFMIR